MRKILILLVAVAALTLTGCKDNSEKPIIDEVSTSTVDSPVTSTASETTSETSTNSSKPVASTTPSASTSTASSEKPVISTASEKPVNSTTSNVEKPAISSTTSSTKPVESKPVEVHTHNFAEATCEKPATCSCGETTGKALGHKYNEGICTICGRVDMNYFAAHNCKKDGHVWGESYTKTSEETIEIKESHNVYANGFDATLAWRYGCNVNPNFSDIFGMEYGSGSKNVKTTATRTVTDYYHKCSECGTTEKYDTDEDVTTSDNWAYVNPSKAGFYTTIWWDIDDIPSKVWDAVEKDKQAEEEWINNH